MYIQINEVEVMWENKLKKISLVEQVVEDEEDEIKALSRYFIKNAFGTKVYIKANTRDLAQLAVDAYYGRGFYKVHSDKGDSPKGGVTVRCVATRRGQAVQRSKAKILNS